MRRRSNTQRDISFDPTTPVETRRQYIDSFAASVLWPVAQSIAIAMSTVALVASVVLSPLLMGDRAFWFGCGIVALGSFVYGLRYEVNWMDRLSWPLVSGVVFWCLYAFSAGVFDVPHSPWLALFSLISVIFTGVLCFWLWLSVGQKLLQQSLHQERYLWEIIANVIEWMVKKPRPRPLPPMVKTGRGTLSGNGQEPEAYSAPPVEDLTEIEMFLMLADEYKTLARDDSQKAQGLRGKILANGETLTKNGWRRCITWLLEYGYIEEASGGGYRWLNGASAQIALEQFDRIAE